MEEYRGVDVNLLIDNCDVPAKNYTDIHDPGRLTERVGWTPVAAVADVERAV
ncbi:hypothetical protein [Malonomonas rubra]|uniref:hypothetical protein n=1 Tax=Malonomonas rubra TaxID=57040 RepID=UPI0026EBEAEF|nr:hypothetical protein [Malonomonas rubra]